MSNSEEKAQYLEEVGVALEGLGLPRMLGRVVGALLLADPPERSADRLAADLHASAGTISMSTRALEEQGIVERVHKAGDRKQYFRLRAGAWHALVRRRIDAFQAAIVVAEKGQRIFGSGTAGAGRGLREMLEFMRLVVNEDAALLATWKRELAGQDAA